MKHLSRAIDTTFPLCVHFMLFVWRTH